MTVVWLTEATRWVVWLLSTVFIAVIRCLLSFPFVDPFLPFVKSIKALSKKRDKTVTILRLLSYF